MKKRLTLIITLVALSLAFAVAVRQFELMGGQKARVVCRGSDLIARQVSRREVELTCFRRFAVPTPPVPTPVFIPVTPPGEARLP